MRDETGLMVGLDIGTSGVKATAFDAACIVVAQGRAALRTDYRDRAGASQRPSDWWSASVAALGKLGERLGERKKCVRAIGLTGQCPTFTLMDKAGNTPDVSWLYQDAGAEEQCRRIVGLLGRDAIHARTGQNPGPYYIAPKLMRLAQSGNKPFGGMNMVVQPRDFIGWKLTGSLATDPTHAACTLLYDVRTGAWAEDWIQLFHLESFAWPDIAYPDTVLGGLTAEASAVTGWPRGLPVSVGAADSLCACYGVGAQVRPGVLYDVSGTSTCLHMVVGGRFSDIRISHYPYFVPGTYCIETGLNTTGASLAWLGGVLRRSVGELLDDAALVPPGAGGLLFLPHLGGGDRDVPGRPGAFVGLNMSHRAEEMARAVLEGVAFAIRDKADMLRSSGAVVREIVGCGGGNRSRLWNEIKSAVLDLPLGAPEPTDTAALGAARTAAAAVGLAISLRQPPLRSFIPQPDWPASYEDRYEAYRMAVRQLERTGT